MASIAEAEGMLSFIAPSDHDTRYRIGMALHSGLGEGGYSIFDRWLQRHANYRPELRSWGRSHWRSLGRGTSGRPIGYGTLVHMAREAGWAPTAGAPRMDPVAYARERADERERQARALEARAGHSRKAEARARDMLSGAELARHPYLAAKGFPDEEGFVYDGLLLIPIFALAQDDRLPKELRSVQTVRPDGTKRFIFGSDMTGGGVRLGPAYAREVWFVEGYATALSVREALRRMPIANWQVVACMSDSGLARETDRHRYNTRIKGYVLADHDDWLCRADPPHTGKPFRWLVPPCSDESRCPDCGSTATLRAPAGERAARQSGMPWWTPYGRGDANDFHQAEGAEALTQIIRWLRAGNSLG